LSSDSRIAPGSKHKQVAVDCQHRERSWLVVIASHRDPEEGQTGVNPTIDEPIPSRIEEGAKNFTDEMHEQRRRAWGARCRDTAARWTVSQCDLLDAAAVFVPDPWIRGRRLPVRYSCVSACACMPVEMILGTLGRLGQAILQRYLSWHEEFRINRKRRCHRLNPRTFLHLSALISRNRELRSNWTRI
jgi:hypothetical protein